MGKSTDLFSLCSLNSHLIITYCQLVWCIICIQSIINMPSLCTVHIALACDIYMFRLKEEGKKNPISCCFSVSRDYLFIHGTESEAWFIMAVFLACQEIWGDNLLPVRQRYSTVQTVKYSRQLNLKTQRPRLEAVHVAVVAALIAGTYGHAALRGSTGGLAREMKRHTTKRLIIINTFIFVSHRWRI